MNAKDQTEGPGGSCMHDEEYKLVLANASLYPNYTRLCEPKYVDLHIPSVYYTFANGFLQARVFAHMWAPDNICEANHMVDIQDEAECRKARQQYYKDKWSSSKELELLRSSRTCVVEVQRRGITDFWKWNFRLMCKM